VAKRLAQVGGDGQAFRCGGEEFAIVFRNTSARDAFDRLDALRQIIEKSTFQVRGSERRIERIAEIESDRRALELDRRRSARESLRTSARKKAAAGPARSRNRMGIDLVAKGRGLSRAVTRPRSAAASAANPQSRQGSLFPQPSSQPPDRLSDLLSDHVSDRLSDKRSDRLSVTVSIGVAEPSTRYRQPEQVIQAADQALYRAKNKGRNRVELASTAPLRLAPNKRARISRF